MSAGDDVQNPYQSPAVAGDGYVAPPDSGALADKLKNFRSQIHALGGLWVFFGLLYLGIDIGITVVGPRLINVVTASPDRLTTYSVRFCRQLRRIRSVPDCRWNPGLPKEDASGLRGTCLFVSRDVFCDF